MVVSENMNFSLNEVIIPHDIELNFQITKQNKRIARKEYFKIPAKA